MKRMICLLLLMLGLPAASLAADRVALVVGNEAYANTPLSNPVNDATDMVAKLQSLGFHVILATNIDKRGFVSAVERFSGAMHGAEAGLFFFAGHGMQVRGENYLMPVSATVNREADVEFEAVNVGRILAAMEEAGARFNIVILDACRDNPFKRHFRSGSRGLAMVSAPQGTFVAYATAPGDVAADGNGRNGVFTKHILEYIGRPGLTIEDVFRNVRGEVLRETGGRQTPWDNSSLTGRFLFAGEGAQASPPALMQTALVNPKPEDRLSPAAPSVSSAWSERSIRERLRTLYGSEPATIKRNPGNGHWYMLVKRRHWWKTARENSEKMGGHLLTITSAEEYDWIRENMFVPADIWLGLTDEVQEGKWEWVTGERFDYDGFWGKGEPNNAKGKQDHCFFWKDGKGRVADFYGDRTFYYLCEFE